VKGITPLKTNRALRYLWARHRITILSDFNQLRSDDRRIREITELGLTYNLLTAYTSFVAVDTEIRNQLKRALLRNEEKDKENGSTLEESRYPGIWIEKRSFGQLGSKFLKTRKSGTARPPGTVSRGK
jgi:hypothetical protein